MRVARNAGFTLVELIVVLVILGILAGIALPRFLNQTTNATNKAIASTAAGLTAASADNYARRAAGDTTTTQAVTNCTDIGTILANSSGGAITYASPTLQVGSVAMTITTQAITAGNSATCVLSATGVTSVNFRALGIS